MIKLKFIQNLSIRNKIMAIILFLTYLSLCLGFGIIAAWDLNRIKKEIQSNLELNAKLVGDHCIVPLTFDDKLQATKALSRFRYVDFIENAHLHDKDGKLFASYPDSLTVQHEHQDTQYENGYYYIQQAIIFQNELYGTIYIKAKSTPLIKAKQNFIFIISVLTIVLILLSLFLARKMQRIISLPIINLNKHIDHLAESHDFSVQLTKISNDEIGNLYDGFNNLTNQIQIRSKERDVAEANYQDSQNKLGLALQGGEIGIWEWEFERDLTIWDTKMEQLFGLNKGEFGQTYDAFKACLHPDDIAHTEKAIQNALNGIAPYNTVYRVIWKNKEVKFIRAKALIIKDKDENPTAMIGVCIDITDIKNAELKIKSLNDNLEKRILERTAQLKVSNKELEAFAYSVSHDLRTPLRAINGFTRILMEDYVEKLDDEGKRIGDVIQKNAQKMGKLIDDLLDFSRLGRASMQFSDIDMKNMVNTIYHEATSSSERKRIKFSVADLPDAYGDTNMFRQVWMNLISNAIKFSSKREKTVISITGTTDDENVTYRISDNGAGFDMQYVTKIFDVFQRLHGDLEYPGTGVGLSLVQRIINRHKGKIWAESEVDKGATFYFSLPKKSRLK